MIRSSTLLVIASLGAFTFQGLAAFDKEVTAKAAKFLEQKRRLRELRAHIYPGVHPEKKAINEQEYLQKKGDKLLQLYEKQRANAKSNGLWNTGVGLISGFLLYSSCVHDSAFGAIAAGLLTLGCTIGTYSNFTYVASNPSCKTEEDKNAALGKMLDEKISIAKLHVERLKEAHLRKADK